MYDEAVPPARHAIDRAVHLLDRLRSSVRAEDLLHARLAPCMFGFAEQIALVGDFALRSTYTTIGRDWPQDTSDDETPRDIEGLTARLGLARSLLDALDPADFAGAGARNIHHVAGDARLTQSAADYLRLFALPNLWFHPSMAFAILRAEGVDVGKAGFDGWHRYPAGFSFPIR